MAHPGYPPGPGNPGFPPAQPPAGAPVGAAPPAQTAPVRRKGTSKVVPVIFSIALAGGTFAGLTLGLGTDGSTCSDGLNMFEAARMAALASRARSPDPDDWLDADAALAMATTGGAAALGFGDAIGRLEAGAQADIVFLRLDRPEYWPLNDAPRQVVFLETGAGVDRVMVGGRTIVERGECVSVDMGALRRDVERLRERLDRVGVDAARLVAALEPIVGRFCVGLARVHHPVEGYAGGPSHRH